MPADVSATREPVRSKSWHAEVFFQRFDLEAHCGLRQEQFFRRLAKAQLLCDGTEHDHPRILKVGHGGIRTPQTRFRSSGPAYRSAGSPTASSISMLGGDNSVL